MPKSFRKKRSVLGMLLMITLWHLCLSGSSFAEDTATPDIPTDAERANANTDSEPAKPAIRRETRQNRLLAEQMATRDPETQVHWLGKGNEAFLGLYRTNLKAPLLASALILHDNQQNPDWPEIVHGLRINLTQHGWNTLSVAVPDYLPVPDLPISPALQSASTSTEPESTDATKKDSMKNATEKRAITEKNNGSNDTKPPDNASSVASPPLHPLNPEYDPDTIPDKLVERVALGLDHLQQQSTGPVVLIAIGSSASIITTKSQDVLSSGIGGLVIINPTPLPILEGYPGIQNMRDLTLPILDISPDFSARSNPDIRLEQAKRAENRFYQSRRIVNLGKGYSGKDINAETQLIKAIRGWQKRWVR